MLQSSKHSKWVNKTADVPLLYALFMLYAKRKYLGFFKLMAYYLKSSYVKLSATSLFIQENFEAVSTAVEKLR